MVAGPSLSSGSETADHLTHTCFCAAISRPIAELSAPCKPFIVSLASRKLASGIEASAAHGDAGGDNGAARIPTSRKPAPWPPTIGTETDEVRRQAVKCPSWVTLGRSGALRECPVSMVERTSRRLAFRGHGREAGGGARGPDPPADGLRAAAPSEVASGIGLLFRPGASATTRAPRSSAPATPRISPTNCRAIAGGSSLPSGIRSCFRQRGCRQRVRRCRNSRRRRRAFASPPRSAAC